MIKASSSNHRRRDLSNSGKRTYEDPLSSILALDSSSQRSQLEVSSCGFQIRKRAIGHHQRVEADSNVTGPICCVQMSSESDLLRERVSNNIGQASDQTVANLVITERIVVSVPADTAICVVLQKPTRESVQSSRVESVVQASHQPSIEELRQLMQLQRELNETAASKSSQE